MYRAFLNIFFGTQFLSTSWLLNDVDVNINE